MSFLSTNLQIETHRIDCRLRSNYSLSHGHCFFSAKATKCQKFSLNSGYWLLEAFVKTFLENCIIREKPRKLSHDSGTADYIWQVWLHGNCCQISIRQILSCTTRVCLEPDHPVHLHPFVWTKLSSYKNCYPACPLNLKDTLDSMPSTSKCHRRENDEVCDELSKAVVGITKGVAFAVNVKGTGCLEDRSAEVLDYNSTEVNWPASKNCSLI